MSKPRRLRTLSWLDFWRCIIPAAYLAIVATGLAWRAGAPASTRMIIFTAVYFGLFATGWLVIEPIANRRRLARGSKP
jgi:hypothetical protein